MAKTRQPKRSQESEIRSPADRAKMGSYSEESREYPDRVRSDLPEPSREPGMDGDVYGR